MRTTAFSEKRGPMRPCSWPTLNVEHVDSNSPLRVLTHCCSSLTGLQIRSVTARSTSVPISLYVSNVVAYTRQTREVYAYTVLRPEAIEKSSEMTFDTNQRGFI